ncbi:filamentous hemagglutinin N-terminal domain-containing protein [Variovorax sp. LARHSF232]
MNKNLHRIVFNAARGMRMVVQETAKSAGKTASGATSAPSSAGAFSLAARAGAIMAVSSAFLALPTQAQIAGDPSAPGNQRPTVLTAPNGVPLVNIQTPSGAGVSRNTYRQFDVNSQGAILNNSRTNVQTQLGGFVQGNPWLARGPARIILNEVNSAHPSQLRGFVEVAGQRAEVIIANPAGIQIDGGGFINANRATLTTGTPQFNAAGSLESFLVRGGTISIDGAGLDARTTDYAAILARAVQVNAGIWANDLKVVAGANTVAADASQAAPTTGSGAAPTFSLDVAQLGGMYAGKITLIGTEAGVGVRNAGHIGAGAGGLIVTAAGHLENVGTLEAPRIELASASDIDNQGTIRQTGTAALSMRAPNLVNTNGGVIGAEPPAPPSPADGGTSGTGEAGGSNPPPEGGAVGSAAGGTGEGGATDATAPAAPPAPGLITAAGTIRNDGGRIYSGGEIALQTPNIDNSGGQLSVSELTVSGPRFSNAGGTLNVARHFSANVEQLDNSGGGTLHAGSIAITATGDVRNGDGQLRSDSDIVVHADGTLQSSGSITAARHVNIQAGSVQGDAASTFGAGVQADDSGLANAGDLRMGAARDLVAQGNNMAAGAFSAQGATVDLAGSRSSAANVLLQATQGNVSTAGASVITPGTLSVTANTAGATWINDAGTAQAGQLQLSTANIRNTQGGEILQTGAGALVMSAMDAAGHAGTIDTSGGRIASNGKDTQLTAASIVNTGGRIEHAATGGALTLATGSYSGTGGSIAANGALVVNATGAVVQDGGTTSADQVTIDAGALSNRGGQIMQTGGDAATRITVAGALGNEAGTIASNADTHISAGSLGNQGGTVRTAGTGNLTLVVAGQLNNSAQGSITSAGMASIDAGSLVNDAGRIVAVQDLTLAVQGTASNVGGSLLANGAVNLNAGSLNNSRGTVAAIEGGLTVAATGALTSTEGQLQSGGQTQIQALGGLDNTLGKIVGQQLRVDTGIAQLGNAQGMLVGVADVRIDSGALTNDAGLIQSGGALAIDTHGQQLSNRNAAGYANAEGGISSVGAMTLSTGTLQNSAGFIGAGGALQANTTGVVNTDAGLIQSATSLQFQTGSGSYDNRGGQTLSGGDLSLAGAVIENSAGLIRGQGAVTLVADRVTNTDTLDAATPREALDAPAATPTTHGIEGGQIAITADVLDNQRGAIRSGGDARILSAGQVLNSGGLMAANGALEIADLNAANPTAKTLAVSNAAGLLVANTLLKVDAKALSLDGTLTSGKDLSIALLGDVHNTGELSANGKLRLATTGNITNSGKLTAGDTLDVSGQDIDNTATGEISATTTRVNAAGTLTNRGLIDGDLTQIDAATLTNIGTGRIYGRELSIQAGTLNNLAETVNGETKAATIAARERLDIGAGTIHNRDGALIYSDGDMAIGGALDANRKATGSASELNNHAATIESAGNMVIDTAQLNNTNGGVTWTLVPGASKHVVEYSVPGSAERWDASQVFFAYPGSASGDWPSWVGASAANPTAPGDNPNVQLLLPAPEYPLERFAPYYATPPASSANRTYDQYHGGNNEYTETIPVAGAWYSSADPIWATFGVAPPLELPPSHIGRQYPNIVVGQTGVTTTYDGPSGPVEVFTAFDHPVTQQEYDEWQAYRLAHQALDVATLKFLRAIDGSLILGTPSRRHTIYDAFDLNISSSTPVLNSSAPGRIIAGGKMDLTVGAGRNEMSQILAGGTLTVKGGTIVNVNKEVDALRETHGQIIHSYVKSHTFGDDERIYEPRNTDLIESTTVTLVAAKLEGNQAVAADRPIDPLKTGQASATAQGGGAVNANTRVNPIVQVPSAVSGGGAASGQAADASGRATGSAELVVRTSTPNTGIPSASLFGINPNAGYLIETDPRFANYRNWLSSDYLLNNLGLDPDTTQKRLGDGFYEQRLIREQIANLTGYRYLGDYTSDEAQYAALMNAGATFAKQYGLRPGIALTLAQMAQLTSDIVWLVEQTVTLPDGSTQKVLVPQVYVRVKPGDIDGSGALLSGKNVDMQLSGDVLNGGTIAGRQAISISADNIQNLGGRISGGSSVDLLAKNDINVIGGRVEAGDRLTAVAGGDIRVESTTRSATSSSAGVNLGTTHLDRVAGLYVTKPGGQLIAVADGDFSLKGAEVKSGGSVYLQAGRDLKLETITTGSQQDIRWSKKNSRQELSTQETGTTVEGQGDVSLVAGRDLSARAATLSAGDDAKLTLKAERDITLEAGVNQDSAQTTHKSKSGIKYYSLDASGKETTLDKTTLGAGQIEIDSGRDTTLSAIEANAKSLDIQAGGKLKLETATTVQDEAWHVTHGSSASVGAKGKGQSDETLHYNQLNVGNLSIDAKGGIQTQVGLHVPLDQLAKQPGMAWVDQILSDPKLANSIEWQRVQEAHDKWDYRQSGMGPVSAALVAVMVGAAAWPVAAQAGAAAGSAIGGATGTVVTGAVQSAVLTLSNQVATAYFNNLGDLGAVFDELGSSQNVKSLATAIVTGGALAALGFVPTGAPTPDSGAQLFLTQLENNLKIQVTSALIGTAINGGNLGDSLKDALTAALINSLAATAANGIGDLTEAGTLDKFTNKLAHLIAGCAAGTAKSGGDGCAPGAIGAAVGELVGEAGRDNPNLNANYTVYMAGLLGGLAAAVAGGDTEQVGLANWSGSNAAANNALGHSSKDLMAKARDCAANPTAACTAQIEAQAQADDKKFQARFDAACTGASASFASCNVYSSSAASALNDLELMRDLYSANPEQRALYQRLIDSQRDDIARTAPLLAGLRAGTGAGDLLTGELAPHFSPADGARLAGSVAGAALGSTKPLGLGSTGRATPINLTERLAMEEAISNPAAGRPLPVLMTDSRWPGKDGWVKMSQNVNGVEIHYVINSKTGAIDDFKFK